MSREIKNVKFYNYFEVLLLILVGFSPLIPQTMNATIVVILIAINYKYLLEINLKKIAFLSIVVLIFTFTILKDLFYYSVFSPLDLYFISAFILGYLISEKYSITDFFKILDKVIFCLACVSLVGVFLYTFFQSIVFLFPKYDYYHTTHITSYIHNFLIVDGSILKRNTGIAWEPGAFQFILNLGFFSYLKINSNYSILRMIVYIVSIVTTISTTGLIILAIILLNYFFVNKKLRYILILLIIISFPVLQSLINYQTSYKFGDAYMSIRFEPLINSFRVGWENLLGYGNIGYERNYITTYQASWDSFGQIVIRYGYPLLVIITYRLLNLIRIDIILFFIVFLTFFTETIWFFPIITCIYFFTYENDKMGEVSLQ